jgi:lactoylglutathione lyase
MFLDHVAIWTNQLEELKDFYVKYFGASPNKKYTNNNTLFESYFLTFDSGCRLEIMKKPGIPENLNDPIEKQHLGIIHLDFGVETMAQVDQKSKELANDGFRIIRGPRKTGDGYYEFETHDPDNNRIEVSSMFIE